MKRVFRCVSALCFIAAAVMLMPGCQYQYRNVTDYALVADEASDLDGLEKYYNLQTLDLRGSECYDAIVEYASANPKVEVMYDVPLGDVRYSSDIRELTLKDGEYDYDMLVDNLRYLTGLRVVRLPMTSLSADQLAAVARTVPGVEIDYTVDVLGKEISGDTEVLDLSALKPSEAEVAAQALGRLPELSVIDLMGEEGSSLSPADVRKLMDAAPDASFIYSFDLFGRKVSVADTKVEFVDTQIGNEGVAQIREALDILPECTYFKLDNCGIDNTVMEKLRDDYPDVKIAWRVFFAFTSCMTDAELVHWTYGVRDEEIQVLKYCTDMVYLDLGHNTKMSDISFVRNMPKLKVAIVVDSLIPSLEPFENCTELEHLEIVHCERLTDLSPLANCKKLKRVNLSASFGILDLSPLYDLPDMERLYLGGNNFLKQQYEEACQKMPDCWVTNTGDRSMYINGEYDIGFVSGNYAIGWRLEEDRTRADWYVELREIFNYDEK